jgi:hypothetical protein
MRRIILRSHQSPGDELMLAVAIRDLHLAHPGQFQTDVRTSADAIYLLRQSESFVFVFLDGDHRLSNVREELELLPERQPRCVMIHDTNSQAAGYPDCEGPPLFKWRLQTTAPYLCLEDNAPRPGEDTWRGMFLDTTSVELFEAARTSLQKWFRYDDQGNESYGEPEPISGTPTIISACIV